MEVRARRQPRCLSQAARTTAPEPGPRGGGGGEARGQDFFWVIAARLGHLEIRRRRGVRVSHLYRCSGSDCARLIPSLHFQNLDGKIRAMFRKGKAVYFTCLG